MLSMRNRVQALIDAQQHHSSGVIGGLIGAPMMRQHAIETDWMLSLLAIEPADQVLEIGFGVGRGIELVAARATNGCVAGIDVSLMMLNAARHRNPTTTSPHSARHHAAPRSSPRLRTVPQMLARTPRDNQEGTARSRVQTEPQPIRHIVAGNSANLSVLAYWLRLRPRPHSVPEKRSPTWYDACTRNDARTAEAG